jgi:hypothetical protein
MECARRTRVPDAAILLLAKSERYAKSLANNVKQLGVVPVKPNDLAL